MIWLDFFLQAFATAMAWCLAVAIVGAFIWAIGSIRVRSGERAAKARALRKGAGR